MGASSRHKRNNRRRNFGQPCGKNSYRFRKIKQQAKMVQEEKNKRYSNDKMKYPHYQLVRKTVQQYGQRTVKIVVRRLPKVNMHGGKFLPLGSNLKFKLTNENLSGYRIMNLDLLKEHVVDITTHACICPKAQQLVLDNKEPVILHSEMCHSGLFSILIARCKGCLKEFKVANSQKQSNGQYDINVRAVWGTVVSGGGQAQLKDITSTLDMPQMSTTMFSNLESIIGKWWFNILKEEMLKAGAEEKQRAILRNDFHQGVPAITVVCDGGWSKRTHKHTFNALGGVAVIFGQETGKLLYIGVRNKHCIICSCATSKGVTAKQHECFKNWQESSSSMESDIILNGFLQAESDHGLRYMRVVADGDSSVYNKLIENVPVWGGEIKKLECANHTCKCIRANLEKLVQEKRHYKGKGKLTGKTIVRLTTAVRCAIRMRSKENNAKLLKHDIKNSIYHIFGFHSNCSNFCKQTTSKDSPVTVERSEEINAVHNDDQQFSYDDDSIDQIFEQQSDFWSIPTEMAMEESRKAEKSTLLLQELQNIIRDVSVILGRVADRSHRLLGNFTTNLAESWMSVRSKFDGGKRVNRCGRGSWATRCYGGGLRKNLGPAWSPIAYQKATSIQPGKLFFKSARQDYRKSRSAFKYKSSDKAKAVRRKRKMQSVKESSCKKAKLDYGRPLDDCPDHPQEEIEKLCKHFYDKNVNCSTEQINTIQEKTVTQSLSELWRKERRKRVTSSNFGQIISRKPNNVSVALVKNLLYTTFKGNINTIRGLAQEEITILEYQNEKKNVVVKKTGLSISHEYPFLAASTDGIVLENNIAGLLEVKNLLQNNKYLIADAVQKVPNFCLELHDKKLRLKRNHSYYYQVQGQLNVFNKPWCDFVVRRCNPHDIFIERITIDRLLWEHMVPKLKEFYFKFLLPELASPRFGTCSGIRKPNAPWCGSWNYNNARKHLHSSHPVEPSCSTQYNLKDNSSEPSKKQTGTSTRKKTTPDKATVNQFVGRKISHQWIERTGETKWFKGTILRVIRGTDGSPRAVYEVQYEGEEAPYQLRSLQKDVKDGTLKFLD